VGWAGGGEGPPPVGRTTDDGWAPPQQYSARSSPLLRHARGQSEIRRKLNEPDEPRTTRPAGDQVARTAPRHQILTIPRHPGSDPLARPSCKRPEPHCISRLNVRRGVGTGQIVLGHSGRVPAHRFLSSRICFSRNRIRVWVWCQSRVWAAMTESRTLRICWSLCAWGESAPRPWICAALRRVCW
jgi:hypothetical protein